MDTNRGILYVAVGDNYLRELQYSIATVRKYTSMPIKAFVESKKDWMDNVKNLHLEIINNEIMGLHLQCEYICKTPFRDTLYMDTEAFMVRKRALEPFHVLNNFDLALSLVPTRAYGGGLPLCVSQVNCGVMWFRKNDKTDYVFNNWMKYHKQKKQNGRKNNQVSFIKLLYNSNVRFLTLGSEFNFRNPSPKSIKHLNIIHSRPFMKYVDLKGNINYPNDKNTNIINQVIRL